MGCVCSSTQPNRITTESDIIGRNLADFDIIGPNQTESDVT